MLLSKHCGIIITCFVGDLLVVSFSTRLFRNQLLFCDVIKVWCRLWLHAFTHYLSTNCLCLQENATINFCPLKVRSRAMGKIMPSDIYHFYPLVLVLGTWKRWMDIWKEALRSMIFKSVWLFHLQTKCFFIESGSFGLKLVSIL